MFSWPTFIPVCIFFVCIAITTGTVYDVKQTKADADNSKSFDADTCSMPGCIYAASRILKSMKSEADPCDDFYEFVCGNYEQSDPMSDLDFFIQPPVEGKLEVDLRLQRIIKDIDALKAPKAFADLKISYEKCMENEINLPELKSSEGTKSMVDGSKVIGRMWESLSEDQWDETLFNYDSAISHLFEFIKKPNSDNVTSELSIKRSPIHWSYLKEGMSNEVVEIYFSYMTNIFIHLGVDKLLEESEVKQLILTEIELSKIVFPENESRDVNRQHTRTTIGELETKYPKLNLKELSDETDDSVVEIKMDAEIIGKLEKWMFGKSKKSIANWSQWRATMDRVRHIHCPYISRRTKMLFRDYYSVVEKRPKWRECVEYVRSQSPFFLDVLYYGQYINKTVVEDFSKIFFDVKQQFIGFIEKAEWLDPLTKQHALQKVRKVKNDLGIYEEFMLDQKCSQSYCDLRLSDGLLANNRVNVTKILKHSIRSSFRKENKTKWDFVQTSANYIQDSVLLHVGAVSYTDNFYNIGQPKALNYAAFGYQIGQQFAHSLDDANRIYDENGHFNQWWDSKSNDTYIDRTQCLIEQYKNYGFVEIGMPVKSITLLNDHIAENVGIKAAYLAFEKWAKDNKPEERLPGLHYSQNQIFWISKANSECSLIYRPQSLRARTFREENSLDKLPINIALSNMPEFANDFKCRRDSKMNPREKCSVW